MPFPVAHALLGASVVIAASPQQPFRLSGNGLRTLALGAFLGILPDLDYLGIWALNLDDGWHRGPSHSLFVAIVVGAMVSLPIRSGSRLRWSMIYAGAMASHGLLDMLLSVNRGVAFLWPLTSYRFSSGLWGYVDTLKVDYHASVDTLVIRGVIQVLEYSAVELVVMGGVLIVTLIVKNRLMVRD